MFALTKVNGIFKTDFAIHMNLINNLTIIYDGSVPDPYGANDSNYNSEMQSILTSVVGEANYDVGHLIGRVGKKGNAGCSSCVFNSGKDSVYTTSQYQLEIILILISLLKKLAANLETFTHRNEGSGVNM